MCALDLVHDCFVSDWFELDVLYGECAIVATHSRIVINFLTPCDQLYSPYSRCCYCN
jgi:hypothetical protein